MALMMITELIKTELGKLTTLNFANSNEIVCQHQERAGRRTVFAVLDAQASDTLLECWRR
jgi:hypothetical protein